MMKFSELKYERPYPEFGISQVGGTMSFSELIQYGNLISPFEDGCVSGIITEIKDWLDHNKDVE